MELFSIILSRAIYFLELDSLNPFGKRSTHETTIDIRDRYSFAQIPQMLGGISMEKGAEFLSGRMGDIAIDRLTLFPNGIVVETRSSTKDSEEVAKDVVEAARGILGSKVSVARKHFVSQIAFRSEMRMGQMNPVLNDIANEIRASLAGSLRQDFVVEPIGVTISIDGTLVGVSPAKFTVERRAGTPFFENIYFSSAPVHTDLHLSFVERFERSLA